MKIKKVESINLYKRKIIKIFEYKKKKFNVKEIYLVQINGKQLRNWRQHLNCKKILFCSSGSFKVEIMQKKKIIKKILKKNNYLEIPKKMIFRFKSTSKMQNTLIVLSDVINNKLITKINFSF